MGPESPQGLIKGNDGIMIPSENFPRDQDHPRRAPAMPPAKSGLWAFFHAGEKQKQGVEKSMEQTQLKVFKGLNIPFSDAQVEAVCTQFCRATISANLPFRWTVDPEIIKLFLMFRSTATDIMPADNCWNITKPTR
ncbi:hypothetical protein B0H10DRAFT_1944001 [Mycena sp. CBHHK59/15]|nr:hypothetical protein B0H10DRAFT_1944001 [Mycena sp. CBHHK59/15]